MLRFSQILSPDAPVRQLSVDFSGVRIKMVWNSRCVQLLAEKIL
jgi:hypothetical protein